MAEIYQFFIIANFFLLGVLIYFTYPKITNVSPIKVILTFIGWNALLFIVYGLELWIKSKKKKKGCLTIVIATLVLFITFSLFLIVNFNF